LETDEGKVLVKKIHVSPEISIAELIVKLKGDVPADVERAKTILKTWVQKMDIKDMQEIQDSRMLFVQHRNRKAVLESLNKTDQASLLKVLTYLSKKEDGGVKFEGIKFSELKQNLEKNGEKAVEEIKKTIQEWISKISFTQLAALKNVYEEAVKHEKGKSTEPGTELRPHWKNYAVVQATPSSNPTPSNTTDPVAGIKTAADFYKYAMSNKKNTSAATPATVRTAAAQVIQHGSTDDIKKLIGQTVSGQANAAIKVLQEGLFKVQLLKANDRIKKAKVDKDWVSLRNDLKTWVNGWNLNQSEHFLIWYRFGGKNKKRVQG